MIAPSGVRGLTLLLLVHASHVAALATHRALVFETHLAQRPCAVRACAAASKSRAGLVCATASEQSVNQREYLGPAPFREASSTLDTLTDGYLLSYANLQPYTPRTLGGGLFLSTNIIYAAVGALFISQGTGAAMGLALELAALLSTWYHWSQLEYGPDAPEVRLALLIDYCGAFSCVAGSSVLIWNAGGLDALSQPLVLYGGIAIASFFAGCVDERPNKYLVFHSMWHIFSALAIAELVPA